MRYSSHWEKEREEKKKKRHLLFFYYVSQTIIACFFIFFKINSSYFTIINHSVYINNTLERFPDFWAPYQNKDLRWPFISSRIEVLEGVERKFETKILVSWRGCYRLYIGLFIYIYIYKFQIYLLIIDMGIYETFYSLFSPTIIELFLALCVFFQRHLE